MTTVTEFGTIVRSKSGAYSEQDGVVQIPDEDFDSLYDFVVSNYDDDHPYLLEPKLIRNDHQIGLRVRNYVGVIQFSSGSVLEILPKIENVTEGDSRNLLIKMLRTVRELPFYDYDEAGMDLRDCYIHEFFITRFIDDVQSIIKNGLASSYYDVEGNENCIKGRIDFPRHISTNYLHKERFYVNYQIFGTNRSENRLIKSTLLLLYKLCRDDDNRRRMNALLSYFEEIPESKDYEGDFKKNTIGRNMSMYIRVMKWAEIFLNRKSFNMYSGDNIAYSLLFPMEKLYESYVFEKLSQLSQGRYVIHRQDTTKQLFDGDDHIDIRPDVWIETIGSKRNIILDTKWKLFDSKSKVSVSDLYQMFAYSVKYASSKTILLYPYSEEFLELEYIETTIGNTVRICTRSIDFNNEEESLGYLIDFILSDEL